MKTQICTQNFSFFISHLPVNTGLHQQGDRTTTANEILAFLHPVSLLRFDCNSNYNDKRAARRWWLPKNMSWWGQFLFRICFHHFLYFLVSHIVSFLRDAPADKMGEVEGGEGERQMIQMEKEQRKRQRYVLRGGEKEMDW